METIKESFMATPWWVFLAISLVCFAGPALYEKLELSSLPDAAKIEYLEKQEAVKKARQEQALSNEKTLIILIAKPFSEVKGLEDKTTWIIGKAMDGLNNSIVAQMFLTAIFVIVVGVAFVKRFD